MAGARKITVQVDGTTQMLDPPGPYTIGSGNDVDVQVPGGFGARLQHAELRWLDGEWSLVSKPSAATYHRGVRTTEVRLPTPADVQLGTESAPTVRFEPAAPERRRHPVLWALVVAGLVAGAFAFGRSQTDRQPSDAGSGAPSDVSRAPCRAGEDGCAGSLRADLDGDGAEDVAEAFEGERGGPGRLLVELAAGPTRETPLPPFGARFPVHTGLVDLNDDGRRDVVVKKCDVQICEYLTALGVDAGFATGPRLATQGTNNDLWSARCTEVDGAPELVQVRVEPNPNDEGFTLTTTRHRWFGTLLEEYDEDREPVEAAKDGFIPQELRRRWGAGVNCPGMEDFYRD